MKIIKNIYLLGFLLTLIGFSACGESPMDYIPAEVDGKAQVYFPDTNLPTVDVKKADVSVSIPISRVGNNDAVTVSLTVTGSDDLFTVPTSVSFAQGENESSIKVTFDGEQLEYEKFYDYKIAISDEFKSFYGKSEYNFKIGAPAPWTSLGKATFVEDFVTTFYGVDNDPYEVEIQENDITPGLFRLVNPFGKAYPFNDPGDWDDSRDWYLEINASDPEGVYMTVQETGMIWGEGMFSVGSLAGLRISQGKTLEEVKADGLTGTFKDGVIRFPTNEMLVGMANYNDGGLYRANGNGAFVVAMPGIELVDYSVDVVYGGKQFDAKGNIEGVVALINEVGEDVDNIKLALVKEEDSEGAVSGIVDGDIESVAIKAQKGKVFLPFEDTPKDGVYTIVAVTFDKDGKPQGSSSVNFKYVGSLETWVAVEAGDYKYSLLFTDEEGNPQIDKDMTLYQSYRDSKRFKIENWGMGVDFVFSYDKATGEVVVEDQETGAVNSSVGAIFVGDLSNHDDESDQPSYFKDGVFNFGVIYYVAAGYITEGGYETFTISSDEEVASSTRSSSISNGLEFNGNFPIVVKKDSKQLKSQITKEHIF